MNVFSKRPIEVVLLILYDVYYDVMPLDTYSIQTSFGGCDRLVSRANGETDVRVKVGIKTEAEAGEEANAEIQPEGTIEIGVDIAIEIDIPDDSLMPDAIERLGQLEEGMQERVVALEVSNTGLQDALGVEMGIKPGLAVVESESEPEEAKADDEADVEVQLKGTIKIRVDVTTGIDIPNKLPMPDTIKRLEQLKESVQGMYRHMPEIPLKRIYDIEAGQTDLQARKLIAEGERSGLLERIVALEGSNTRL
ncbi:hypothetical protein Tco_0963212 [Tanacetum coccineum]